MTATVARDGLVVYCTYKYLINTYIVCFILCIQNNLLKYGLARVITSDDVSSPVVGIGAFKA